MNPYLMNYLVKVQIDIPFWCSVASSLLTLLHSFKHYEVDYFRKSQPKFSRVSVLSKVRLSGILQSFILTLHINSSHGQLQLSTNLHPLMHIALTFWWAFNECGRIWKVIMMLSKWCFMSHFEPFWCLESQSQVFTIMM